MSFHSVISILALFTGEDCKKLQALTDAYSANAMCSMLLTVICILFSLVHDRFLNIIHQRTLAEVDRPNISDFMGTLETIKRDSPVFGTSVENSVCPICLAAWEAEDTIKATPCCHYFHEECLRNWLQRAFTCAVCRREILARNTLSDSGQQVDIFSIENAPEVVGARNDEM